MNYLIFFKNLFKSCGDNFNQLIMWPLAQVLCLFAYCLVFIDIFSITSLISFLFSRYSFISWMPIALLTLLSFLTFNFTNLLTSLIAPILIICSVLLPILWISSSRG